MHVNGLSLLTYPPVCLASSSRIRAELVLGAGLDVHIIKPIVDEDVWKTKINDVVELAEKLAVIKAEDVYSRNAEQKIVIGCDQVISLDGKRYSKPKNKAEMCEQLADFSGNWVDYNSGVCVIIDGVIHSFCETNRVKFIEMSSTMISDFVERYSDKLGCAGVVPMEGVGMQVIEKIEGNLFSVMGMPIHAILAIIRREVMDHG